MPEYRKTVMTVVICLTVVVLFALVGIVALQLAGKLSARVTAYLLVVIGLALLGIVVETLRSYKHYRDGS